MNEYCTKRFTPIWVKENHNRNLKSFYFSTSSIVQLRKIFVGKDDDYSQCRGCEFETLNPYGCDKGRVVYFRSGTLWKAKRSEKAKR